MTSGTVDMPTASAPSVRNARISAGVSKLGPLHARYTPRCNGTPSRAAASSAALRSAGV